MGVFARAFRRADLPVRMSQGFNPRPRFSLPAPLPLGIEGLDEVLELDLARELDPLELCRRLGGDLPDGLDLLGAELLAPGEKAHIRTMRYRVCGRIPPDAIARCLEAKELPVTRREGKTIDIRPYLTAVRGTDDGCEFEIRFTEQGTARPAEVLAALVGENPGPAPPLPMVRTAVNLDVP